MKLQWQKWQIETAKSTMVKVSNYMNHEWHLVLPKCNKFSQFKHNKHVLVCDSIFVTFFFIKDWNTASAYPWYNFNSTFYQEKNQIPSKQGRKCTTVLWRLTEKLIANNRNFFVSFILEYQTAFPIDRRNKSIPPPPPKNNPEYN